MSRAEVRRMKRRGPPGGLMRARYKLHRRPPASPFDAWREAWHKATRVYVEEYMKVFQKSLLESCCEAIGIPAELVKDVVWEPLPPFDLVRERTCHPAPCPLGLAESPATYTPEPTP